MNTDSASSLLDIFKNGVLLEKNRMHVVIIYPLNKILLGARFSLKK